MMYGGVDVLIHVFFALALVGGEGQLHTAAASPQGKDTL
jgi:hypothetical protein